MLVANETACGMFGYTEEEMCGAMKMSQLFTMEDGIKQNVLIERNVDTDGNIVMASGKVVSCYCFVVRFLLLLCFEMLFVVLVGVVVDSVVKGCCCMFVVFAGVVIKGCCWCFLLMLL